MKHLTDYQIQELLSEENRLRKTFYDDHLSSCSGCQEKLAAYKKLFSKIEYADDIKISPDFTKNLLLRAQKLKPREANYPILVMLLPFVLVLSTLAALELSGIISLLSIVQSSGVFISNFVANVSTNLFSWLPSLNVSFELVAISVLTAALYHLLDLLLIKPRFR